MKILFIGFSDLSLQRGSTTHVLELVKHLERNGHQLTVIAQSDGPVKQLRDFRRAGRYMHFESEVSRFLGLLGAMIRTFGLLAQLGRHAEAIYVRDAIAGFLVCLARPFHRKRFILEINGVNSEDRRIRGASLLNNLVTRFFRWTENISIPRAERIVIVSPKMGQFLGARYQLPESRFVVIQNGVDIALFSPRPKSSELMKELNLSQDNFTLGFVGNFAPWQGLETLVDAIPALRKTIPGLKVLLVGTGELTDSLKARIDPGIFADTVILAGEVAYKDVPNYIGLFDLAMAPFNASARNRELSFSPIKVFEYMACGKPFVTTSVFDMDEIMSTGNVGVVIDPDNPEQLLTAVSDLHKNASTREEMSQNCLRLAREHYTWERAAREAQQAIQTTLPPASPSA